LSDIQFEKSYRLQINDLVIESGQNPTPLRIAFRTEATLDATHNKAAIEVYNLARSTRDRISGSTLKVTLEAGYQNRLGLIFTGNILPKGISHPKQGPDVITKLQAGDGENALRTSRVNENFGAKARMTDVLLKLSDKFTGVSAEKAKARIRKGDFKGAFTEFANGFSTVGSLRTEYAHLMATAGLTWSIQNNELVVLGEDETTQDLAFEIGPGSGLIGSPEYGDINNDKHKGAIKFRSLLNAAVAPGRKIVLKSESKNATLKVFHTVCVGDMNGDQWFTEAEGRPL
jgi:hypothetical protein